MESSGTILVVDNDESVCAFLKTTLQDQGFTVLVACSGGKAIKLFREKPTIIVLMDIDMPDLNGPETLKMLQSIRPDVPCFFMTAGSPLKNEHLIGAIDVFEKPFRNFSDVVCIFSEILKRAAIIHAAPSPSETHREPQ